MIKVERNADGTTTITCDENTRDRIWAAALMRAMDPDLSKPVRLKAAEIADALGPSWDATSEIV